jgi:flavin-dependent dehydrogenase
LLVGDAAGLVDPITREGIAFALHSAVLAAGALSAAASRPDRHYQQAVHAGIVPELARAARLESRFFRPAFLELLLQALAKSGPVRDVAADLVSGKQSYRGLRWRLLRTMELGLLRRLLVGALR